MPEDHDNQQYMATFELYYELCSKNSFWGLSDRQQPRVMHALMRKVVAWAGNGRFQTGKALLDSWRNLFGRFPELKTSSYITQERSQMIMDELMLDLPREEKQIYLNYEAAPCPNCFVCGDLHCSIRHGRVVIVDPQTGQPTGQPATVTVSEGSRKFTVPLLARLHIAVPFGAHGDIDVDEESGEPLRVIRPRPRFSPEPSESTMPKGKKQRSSRSSRTR